MVNMSGLWDASALVQSPVLALPAIDHPFGVLGPTPFVSPRCQPTARGHTTLKTNQRELVFLKSDPFL